MVHLQGPLHSSSSKSERTLSGMAGSCDMASLEHASQSRAGLLSGTSGPLHRKDQGIGHCSELGAVRTLSQIPSCILIQTISYTVNSSFSATLSLIKFGLDQSMNIFSKAASSSYCENFKLIILTTLYCSQTTLTLSSMFFLNSFISSLFASSLILYLALIVPVIVL